MSGAAEELRALMAANGLTQRRVAELAAVSLKTVESWLARPGASNHRAMPDRALLLVRLALEAERGKSKRRGRRTGGE